MFMRWRHNKLSWTVADRKGFPPFGAPTFPKWVWDFGSHVNDGWLGRVGKW